jgi:hypothetical protein
MNLPLPGRYRRSCLTSVSTVSRRCTSSLRHHPERLFMPPSSRKNRLPFPPTDPPCAQPLSLTRLGLHQTVSKTA